MASTHGKVLAAIVAAGSVALLLAGCTAPIVVEPAPYASDPRCAAIMLGAPETLGGQPMLATSSQATAAYGEEATMVVRCGVEPPGPSQEQCLAVEGAAGAQDWLVIDQKEAWVAVSFGRTPAVELTVPKIRADQALGELLVELSTPASMADANGLECR